MILLPRKATLILTIKGLREEMFESIHIIIKN